MAAPDYVVKVPETYESDDGEKTYWTKVGVAWKRKGGSIGVKIAQHISVSGEFVLFEPDEDGGGRGGGRSRDRDDRPPRGGDRDDFRDDDRGRRGGGYGRR